MEKRSSDDDDAEEVGTPVVKDGRAQSGLRGMVETKPARQARRSKIGVPN